MATAVGPLSSSTLNSLTRDHGPIRGSLVEIYVSALALGERTEPTADTVTVATSAPAKGATSITISALTTAKIVSGQWLSFTDPSDGKEYLAQLTADAVVTDTTLTVAALDESIPVGSQAEFPPYLWDRTDTTKNSSYNLASVTTFNSGGNRDGVLVSNETTLSLPGVFYRYNAAARTLVWAAQNQREVYIQRIFPGPNSAFTLGDVTKGAGTPTSVNSGSPVDGFISLDFEVALLGAVTEADPTPT